MIAFVKHLLYNDRTSPCNNTKPPVRGLCDIRIFIGRGYHSTNERKS
jgi:hypothetical protein